ncbi:MAG: TOBE domain-containing protein, partial [Acutalibacteraceae bacterium]|nr:TOBE domain-containing protein [Acutalibacteraceae bacterium]
ESIQRYANAMEAKVEVTELMGAEIYLYLTVGSASVTARVAPTSKAKPGDTIKIAFDLSKLHIFDKETEKNISLPADLKD